MVLWYRLDIHFISGIRHAQFCKPLKHFLSKQGKDKISEHKHKYRDQYKQLLSVDGTTPPGHPLTVTLAAIGSKAYSGVWWQPSSLCARTTDKLPALLWRLKYVLTVKHEVYC